MEIRITRTRNPKKKPDENSLVFGHDFTDHMFIMNYTQGEGWHDPRVEPYGPLQLDPSTMVFHYAQETFEGLKAYKTDSGDIQLFRAKDNAARLNQSNERMCIPTLDEEDVIQAIATLVKVDQDWIPKAEGTSLYIRPFVIATDPFVGVKASSTYLFMIILSPVGAYYKEGISPVKIYVEDKYVRAVPGGIGFAKTGGNYAASLMAQVEAGKKGYSQVLWLDGIERKYVEEVGTSNVFCRVGNKIYTPPLQGSILSGITRDSAIKLLRSWDIEVIEERFTIEQLFEWHRKGELQEVFATGTAAVISPIGALSWQDNEITINNNEIGQLSQRLYNSITKIQNGQLEDSFSWITSI
ncbi:branched-chain amino acid aminotransferase [Alkalibaculum sp. M08DMB]|uniref:Branched-chain-amino-acid aminotransferase n=1 Tax=Alkalibaculum sporogenes TaxID=2655001 RepID=A0A6A7K9P3_9FIRM|nr:branched-chain amino acid aminotransferase [Alkalibaculum sporogenes]MPW26208.1 branched-chain amino acid aminotransferase [Alkalibaculum sporogenes]